MAHSLYEQIAESKRLGLKKFAVLVDPDKAGRKSLEKLCVIARDNKADYFFTGGSLLTTGNIHETISIIKQNCHIPVVIFPGSEMQVDPLADAILFLSLISGRNPDLLIGKHILAAPRIRDMNLEAIPTGYILVDGGNVTAVQYVSNTKPIPVDKPELAVCTAIAGEMLGMRLIFLEAGSGALNPVPEHIIADVSRNISIPLIVGGGIRSGEKAYLNFKAGADLIVVGNHIEKNPSFINDIAAARNAIPVSSGS